MNMIVNHTGNKGPVIINTMMLTSENMIDKEDHEIINKYFGHSDPFHPGTFRGSSEVDISLSQTRVELENIVGDNLIITGTWYK